VGERRRTAKRQSHECSSTPLLSNLLAKPGNISQIPRPYVQLRLLCIQKPLLKSYPETRPHRLVYEHRHRKRRGARLGSCLYLDSGNLCFCLCLRLIVCRSFSLPFLQCKSKLGPLALLDLLRLHFLNSTRWSVYEPGDRYLLGRMGGIRPARPCP
jgi:hypothetical protein